LWCGSAARVKKVKTLKREGSTSVQLSQPRRFRKEKSRENEKENEEEEKSKVDPADSGRPQMRERRPTCEG
jgi:hypothetical protein